MIELPGHLPPIPLIIIWGSKAKAKVISEGRFRCPNCRTTRAYERKQLSKYFTLYFIPLFETEKIADYLERQTCRTPFKPEVLELSTTHRADEFITLVTSQLEAGMPVAVILTGPLESGAPRETAALILYAATRGKLARCPNCQFTYTHTLTHYSNCGHKLQPTDQ